MNLGYWNPKVSHAQAAAIGSTFSKILSQVLGHHTTAIDDLDFLSPEDRSQIKEWNSQDPIAQEVCVHDLIFTSVKRPEAPAIYAWDGKYSYEELDKISSLLAQHLISLGIGQASESMVPLCFEKSAWAVISMIAVLKTGAAYVQLDPTHPVSRLQTIIATIGSNFVLTSSNNAHLFGGMQHNRVVSVNSALIEQLLPTSGPQSSRATPSAPAFVVFTSGSTGTPKGVIVEHRSFSTMALAQGPLMQFSSQTRALQFAAHTFDISNHEVLTTLVFGGCICIMSEHDRLNNLAQGIHEMKVNWLCLTPTVANLLSPEEVPLVETLVLGGEAVSYNIFNRWSEKVQLFNSYGPSECTVWTSTARLRPGMQPINIGRGVASRLWIVDPTHDDRLAPIGCVGELLVEGPILARSYLHDDEKTRKAFVENPQWAKIGDFGAGKRLYKTGDLVRYNYDGTMIYIGRNDSQVKVHGQRIELGEVELHMQNKLGGEGKLSIVVLAKAGPYKDQLVAVINTPELATESRVDTEMQLLPIGQYKLAATKIDGIRDQLLDRLPQYMVPSAWIMVDAFPLTISGKIDRSKVNRWVDALSAVETGRIDTEILGDERPLTEMEVQIRSVWSEVLNITEESIGLHKSFLRLGGDSITAMQVVSRCRGRNIAVSVQDVLRTNTLVSVAEKATFGSQTAVSKPELSDQPFGLSPVQQLYFNQIAAQTVDSNSPGESAFNQSVLLRLNRFIESEELSVALRAVVKRHSMLRARFGVDGNGKWSQLVLGQLDQSYEFNTYQISRRSDIPPLTAACHSSINIIDGPVFAASLFNVDQSSNQSLFLVAHHLVVDLMSWRIIVHDLEQVLESHHLPPETAMSFQSWSSLQDAHIQHYLSPREALPIDFMPADLEYWGMRDRENIRADAVLEEYTLSSSTSSMLFGAKTNDALRTQPMEIILSALIYSFHLTFNDRSPPTFFIEGHGREPSNMNVDLSETVGWFTTMAPVFVSVLSGETVIRTLQRTKDTRRLLPDNGRPYFASRFLTEEGQKYFQSHDSMEVLFNYAGRYQQLEREESLLSLDDVANVVQETNRLEHRVRRPALFEISANFIGGKTQISIKFNSRMNHEARIRSWIHLSKSILENAVVELEQMGPRCTLIDFPLMNSTYEELAELETTYLPDMNISNLNDIEDIYPCSPMQQGMLLTQMKTPDAYRVMVAGEILSPEKSKPIDVARLRVAWQQVVDRHASLRTVFLKTVSRNGFSDQIVLKGFGADIQYQECDDNEVTSAVKSLSPLKFDNIKPSHRLTILRSTSGKVYSVLEISHTLMDGTSTTILMRDLILAYEGRLPQARGPLYSNYVHYLQKMPSDQAIHYWTDYLKDVEPCVIPRLGAGIESMEDLARRKQLEKAHGSLKVDLPAASLLQNFCSKHGITIANLLLTAWAVVLRVYTKSEQVCYGYLASGRDAPVPDIENTVGLFINMLVFQVDFSNDVPLLHTMKKMQDDYLRSLPHQHCSLAEIQHALGLSGRQLFNTCVSLQRFVSTDDEKSEIDFEKVGGEDPPEVSSPNVLSFAINNY